MQPWKKQELPLGRLPVRSGYPQCVSEDSRDLAQAFGTLEKVEQATEEELTAIQDVGEIVAQSITEFFSFAENKLMIDRLLGRWGTSPCSGWTFGRSRFTGMDRGGHGDIAFPFP